MSFAAGLAALFSRDLTRLIQELEAFPNDEALWQRAPGVTNSAGNLVLHLEGNLREFIGRQLGGIAYRRARDQEFALNGATREDLVERMKVDVANLDVPDDAEQRMRFFTSMSPAMIFAASSPRAFNVKSKPP